MENAKNSVFIIGLLTLIVGLLIGYFVGMSRPAYQQSAVSMPSGMHGAVGGMMMGLEGKTGDALDRAFLDEMIVHHQGALEMARILLRETKRPELIKLGNDIITAQTGEIEMMQEWRTTWFGR